MLPQYQQISKFPGVRRDIAVVVDAAVQAQAIAKAVEQTAGELIDNLRIFDVYSGEGIGAGRKSIALAITLQHPDRTLTDHEAKEVIERVVGHLKNEFNVTLRA